MPTFSEQIVDDSGYQRPVGGAVVYLLNADDTLAATNSPNPTLTDDFGAFTFTANDGVYKYEARIGGMTIACGNALIGVPPQYVGPPGPPGPPGTSGDGGVSLHDYPGTTVIADPNRLDNDNARYAAAQADVRNRLSPNYGKIIYLHPFKGSAEARHIVVPTNDPVTGQPVPSYAIPPVGSYMIDAWSQNGEVLQETPTVIYANVGTSPGNLMSDTRLHFLPGAGLMRPPRPDFGGILRPLMICGDPNRTPATTSSAGVDTQSDVYNNVEIVCHGNAAFYGENYRYGYREHFNDISINGGTNVRIISNHYGSMSDCVYCGAGNVGDGKWNRHNKRWYVEIFADGLNRLNRNALSIIDGVNIKGRVVAYNYTRPGGPGNDPFNDKSGILNPGAVDVEPNAFTDDPHVDDIALDVYAEKCGSSAVATLLIDNDLIPTPLGSMRFTGKAVKCAYGNHTLIGGNNMRVPYDIIVEVGMEDSVYPGQVFAGQGCRWRNIRALRSQRPIQIGYPGNAAPQDFWIENSYFQQLGLIDTGAFQVRGWNGGGFINSQIANGNGRGLHFLFNSGTSPIRNITLDGLEFVNRPDVSPVMSVAIDVDPSNGGPQIFPSTITERDIRYNGIQNNRWAVAGSNVTSLPGFGIWQRGQEIFADPRLEPGAPRVMRTFDTNASGPPFWYQQELIQPVPALSSFGGTLSGVAGPSQLTNMRVDRNVGAPGTIQFTAIGANGRWRNPTALSSFTLELHAPFSGSQTVYVGGSATPNPTSENDLTFGIWFNDTTGGVLGKTRAVQSGQPAGTPSTSKYGDKYVVQYQSGSLSTITKKADGESTSETLYSTGAPTQSLYAFILIKTPGETIILRGATL